MFGMPLHPLVVHFPIVLTFLLPVSIVAALWTIRRGTTPRRAWAVPLAVAAALALSAFAATRTGESEEDRVERVVTKAALHGHEEAGERLMVLSSVLLVVVVAGLLPRTAGQAARLVAAGGALALITAAVQVGHSGGQLVYRHGAASAYTDSTAAPVARDRVTAGSRTAARAARAERDDGDGR